MISSISFVILSVVYNLILSTTFFYKSHIKSPEIKLFSELLVANLIGLILEIVCYVSLQQLGGSSMLPIVMNKLFLFYFIIFASLFAKYFISISFSQEEYEKIKGRVNFLFICMLTVAMTMITILPIEFSDTGKIYSYGYAVNVVYVFISVLSMIMMALFIIRFKHIDKKKCVPCIAFIMGCGIVGIVQKFYPDITLSTPMEMLVLFIMCFTIENPDMKMIEQLNIARDQADKANNAKSEFLSSMSHEIRTPLNAIVGFSQALCEEDLPAQAKDEVKDIMMASETLLDIVNGILDISKIEANKLEIVNVEYSFNQTFDELVSLTKARLGEKPLDFRYSIDPALPKYFNGDKVRVKQVILNLLTNAVKYTHEGWIDFKVNCVNQGDVCRLIISVEDSGIGIKPESINKLFSKFERLDIEKNNTIEGTGLGLAITKKLVDLMGGKIVVQSVYGQGSKFTIALDQKIVTNPTNPALENTQSIALNAVEKIDLTNKRILVVDDNKVNLKVASRLLQDYHCIVDTLDNGQACIDKITMGASYDLILMDDMMPKMGGVETFHNLQKIEGFSITKSFNFL